MCGRSPSPRPARSARRPRADTGYDARGATCVLEGAGRAADAHRGPAPPRGRSCEARSERGPISGRIPARDASPGAPAPQFRSGQDQVDDWLVNEGTPASGEASLGDPRPAGRSVAQSRVITHSPAGRSISPTFPRDVVRRLPRRQLPIAVLAWLGVHEDFQGRGLGRSLLASTPRLLRRWPDLRVRRGCPRLHRRRSQGILSAIRFSGTAGAPISAVLDSPTSSGP